MPSAWPAFPTCRRPPRQAFPATSSPRASGCSSRPGRPRPSSGDQVRIVMDHLRMLVEDAGSNMDCLLKVIVWLKDQRNAEEFDKIYRTYFTSRETLPARTRMQAGRTPMDCGLEVEAIGYVPKKPARGADRRHKRRGSRLRRSR